MKLFVDLGAYNGDSIEQFYNWFKLVDDTSQYAVYGFEPNEVMFQEALVKHTGRKNLTLRNWAAYTYDGQIEISLDDVGTTVMKDKEESWKRGKHTKVKCFHFSKWLSQMHHNHDIETVVVKMDIEGAEFPVLRQLMDEDSLKLIDLLLVEFHPNKVISYTTTDKNNLVLEAKRHTNIVEWH